MAFMGILLMQPIIMGISIFIIGITIAAAVLGGCCLTLWILLRKKEELKIERRIAFCCAVVDYLFVFYSTGWFFG